MRRILGGALAIALLAASLLLLFALARRLPLDAFQIRFADHLLIAGALLSVLLAVLKAPENEKVLRVPGSARFVLGTLAVVAALAATRLHYQGWSFYTTLTASSIGAAVAAFVTVAFQPFPKARGPNGPPLGSWGYRGLFLVGTSALLGRLLLPGSSVQTWILAPLFVLWMPGLALGAALLPRSTGTLERILWAPVLSLGALVMSLIWLDWLGVAASFAIQIAVAIFFTLAGAAAVRWTPPRPGSGSPP